MAEEGGKSQPMAHVNQPHSDLLLRHNAISLYPKQLSFPFFVAKSTRHIPLLHGSSSNAISSSDITSRLSDGLFGAVLVPPPSLQFRCGCCWLMYVFWGSGHLGSTSCLPVTRSLSSLPHPYSPKDPELSEVCSLPLLPQG